MEIEVISIIIGIITIVAFAGKFISNQTKISVQLAQIQMDVTELKDISKSRDYRISKIEERIYKIETNCEYIQSNKKEANK